MAIKALEQEECEDVISRQMVLDKWENTTLRGRTEFDQVIMMLPSVKPQEQKTDVFDKIRVEIQENIDYNKKMNYQGIVAGLLLALNIINKYLHQLKEKRENMNDKL